MAFEQEAEARAWQMWLIRSSFWSKEEFVPYHQFRDKFLGKDIDRRSTDEILDDIEAAENELRMEV